MGLRVDERVADAPRRVSSSRKSLLLYAPDVVDACLMPFNEKGYKLTDD
jgi:hypothetical protein